MRTYKHERIFMLWVGQRLQRRASLLLLRTYGPVRYGCYAANDHPDMSLAVAVQSEESANEQLEHLHLKSPSAPQKQALEYSDA